jgi:hypothetical protein
MPADYFGLGHAQVAVYRPETSEWFLRGDAGETVPIQFGEPGDQAVAAGFAPAFGSWRGTHSGVRDRLALVIRTPEQWTDWWNTVRAAESSPEPVPVVDFRRQMVVAVFQGERPSGGYAISIGDIRYGEAEIQVDVTQREAASGALTAQVLTQPFCMVISPPAWTGIRRRSVHAGGLRNGRPGLQPRLFPHTP